MDIIERYTTRRARTSCLIAGLFAAFAIVVGGEVYRTNSVAGLFSSPATAAVNLALFAVATIVCTATLLALVRVPAVLERRSPRPAPAFFGQRRGLLVMWAIIFAAYLPCLLAYWPGLFSYDIPTQTNYIFTGHWTTQQPPLHTLLWAVFLKLEGVLGLKAITWFELAQMLFLSWSFAYVLSFLARRGVSRVAFAIACVFFALNPVMAVFSVVPVKDVLLAGVMGPLLVGVAQLVADPRAFFASAPRCIGFGACALACCLLRSNMLVAFALFAVIGCFAFKDARKKATALFVAPVLAALVVVGPVYGLANISAGSSAIASLPFQQVVNVVRNHADELPESELAVVEGVLPAEKAAAAYNPRFADKVVRLFKGKESGTAALKDEIMALGKQWIAWGVRYPGDYLDAFLALNIPYWYPLAETPDPYSQRAYIETALWRETEYYSVQDASLLPDLRAAYERVADFSALSGPATRWLFSPSTAVWVVALAALLLYNGPRRRHALLALLPLLFWASFLIGPVSNMRYLFPLFSLYPLLVCAALQPTCVFASRNGKSQGRGNTSVGNTAQHARGATR